MWIVKIALTRPYTFVVLAVLILLMGGYAIRNTPTDIFPNIRIPIAAVIWRYSGLLPEEMANRIVLFSERAAQTTVNDVEHTESQSVNSTAVVKYLGLLLLWGTSMEELRPDNPWVSMRGVTFLKARSSL